MIKNCLILSWCCLVFLDGMAQNGVISGKITDYEEENPLIGANLILNKTSDTTRLYYAISDVNGNFRFEKLEAGDYRLQIRYLGYQLRKQVVSLTGASRDMGILTLKKDATQLNEVVIEEKVVPVTTKGDTTQFNARAYKTSPDASAEDLITKMPGIVVENGTVQAQGENVQKVLVDGREFFGEDPNLALKNLPAEVIDKIEVFDEASEQSRFSGFDDGQTTKTINIVTKVEMRNGVFGQVYGGGGTDERYKSGGNINQFDNEKRISIIGLANNINQQNFSNEDLLGVLSSGSNRRRRGFGGGSGRGGNRGGGSFRGRGNNAGDFLVGQQNGITTTQSFGINYTDEWGEKLKLTGSYFFNKSDNTAIESLSRETFLTDGMNQFYVEDNQNETLNFNHRLNLRMEYQINDYNSIIFTPRISFQDNETISRFFGENASFINEPISETTDFASSDNTGYNVNTNLLYRHRFEKRGRTFSVNFSSLFNQRDGNDQLQAFNKFFSRQTVENDSLNQETLSEVNGYTLSTNLVYTEPLSNKMQLQLSYNGSYSENMSDRKTYDLFNQLNEVNQLDTALSNEFENDYLTHRMATGVMFRDGKIMFRGNVSYQSASLQSEEFFPENTFLERKFDNILPTFMLRYNISREKNLRVFYRTQTNAPSVNQLQNVINNANPLLITGGNQALKQDYTHMFVSRYSNTNAEKSSSFFAFLMLRKTSDYIGNSTFVAQADTTLQQGVVLNQGSQFTQPVNLDGYWNLRSFISFGMPNKLLKSNINLNTGITYTRTPGLINQLENVSKTLNLRQGVVIGSNISQNVDFTLSYTANYNLVNNSLQSDLDNNYFLQTVGVKFNWIFWKGINLKNELNHQLYRGLSDEFNDDFLLWNVSIGKKLFRHQRGELRATVFDLLGQNISIARSVTDSYIEDVNTQVLQQYFMLSFIYNIRNFKGVEGN
ncbi:TonB-dependent receptor [Fulvivirgaceae bacterium BMA12]|uniref:TonB-dependent receptor n=1 Tax=Agaribacillus aureus TaxID=3051825 RepID=A0ABT8L7Q0_9BACT|nr:TonB-dependent receptor [Fulvivirgaceae bacterium BMA12]